MKRPYKTAHVLLSQQVSQQDRRIDYADFEIHSLGKESQLLILNTHSQSNYEPQLLATE